MKKNILRKIVSTAVVTIISLAGIYACAQGSTKVVQLEIIKINVQPEDQLVPIGSNAVFTVKAQSADAYQWLHNEIPLNGATNTSFTVQNARTTDVGYYSCKISTGVKSVSTRAASLMVYASSIDPQTGIDPVVVYATPITGSGSQGTCPGAYTGYVNYTKTIQQGWGWSPDTNGGNTIFTVTDTNRTNTKVEYVGAAGDSGCGQTTSTVPNPPYSPAYRFSIYFTNNVPTSAYGITLTGFNP